MPEALRRLTRLRGWPVPSGLVAAAAALLCVAGAAAAPHGQPRPEPPPALQCPSGDPICTYSERRLDVNGYRYQTMMLSGGADWSTQFWVRDAQEQVVLAIPPLRGNAYLAVERAAGGRADPTPAVRVISYYYGPDDPAVAPSGLSSTIYRYDATTNTLVADEPVTQPIATPEDIRQTLTTEGWTLIFPVE